MKKEVAKLRCNRRQTEQSRNRGSAVGRERFPRPTAVGEKNRKSEKKKAKWEREKER
jgi:hypothetical protein